MSATKEFGRSSTTDDVLEGIDLSGKRVLVTGVSSGLGVETARAIISHGGQVVGGARDVAKAEEACAGFNDAHPDGLELVELDLASMASVRACADRLLAAGKPFDVVIGNAGVMALPPETTADGLERQFGINHIGHFLLINRIRPLLHAGSRVVMLASRGHRVANVNLDDPNFERTDYDPLVAYGRSKSANILFAVEFDRRHKADGIRATALHPGGIRTGLTRYMAPETMQRMVQIATRAAEASGVPLQGLKSVEQGAATSVWAAFTAPADLVGGRYCEDCHVAETKDEVSDSGVCSYAVDPANARALWAKSEEIVGEKF